MIEIWWRANPEFKIPGVRIPDFQSNSSCLCGRIPTTNHTRPAPSSPSGPLAKAGTDFDFCHFFDLTWKTFAFELMGHVPCRGEKWVTNTAVLLCYCDVYVWLCSEWVQIWILILLNRVLLILLVDTRSRKGHFDFFSDKPRSHLTGKELVNILCVGCESIFYFSV